MKKRGGRDACHRERLQKPQGLNSSSDFYPLKTQQTCGYRTEALCSSLHTKKERWVYHHKRHRGHRFSEARSFSAFMLLSDKHASFKKPPAVCICALQADGKRDALHRREQNICICTLDTLLRAGELNEPLHLSLSPKFCRPRNLFTHLSWGGTAQMRLVCPTGSCVYIYTYNLHLQMMCANYFTNDKSWDKARKKKLNFEETDVSNKSTVLYCLLGLVLINMSLFLKM